MDISMGISMDMAMEISMVISMVITMVNDSPPDESQSVATCTLGARLSVLRAGNHLQRVFGCTCACLSIKGP